MYMYSHVYIHIKSRTFDIFRPSLIRVDKLSVFFMCREHARQKGSIRMCGNFIRPRAGMLALSSSSI